MRGYMYAEQYPNSIRAIVLDGLVDHNRSTIDFTNSESNGFSLTQRRMLEWMSANTTSALHGRDVVDLYRELVERADKNAIPAPSCVKSETCRAEVTGDDILGSQFQPCQLSSHIMGGLVTSA